jgi:tRNA1Val (adenine37-N6)-methyltransferase
LEEYTADTLFDPPLTIFQPKTGYRFSLDPIILAAHIHPAPEDRIMDLGCGCGIMPLILGARYKEVQILGVEIQKTLADLAQKNAAQNHMADRIRILHKDLRTLTRTDIQKPVDIIISNPPYIKKTAGRHNLDMGRTLARHEITLDIITLVGRADMLLQPRGQLCLIFPASRLAELTAALAGSRFQADWIRFVHFQHTHPARRVLIHAVKTMSRSCTTRPPFHLFHRDGTPTQEHRALLQG